MAPSASSASASARAVVASEAGAVATPTNSSLCHCAHTYRHNTSMIAKQAGSAITNTSFTNIRTTPATVLPSDSVSLPSPCRTPLRQPPTYTTPSLLVYFPCWQAQNKGSQHTSHHNHSSCFTSPCRRPFRHNPSYTCPVGYLHTPLPLGASATHFPV